MNETEFIDSLRHYLPEAETFLLETLSQENLSCRASSTLTRIQDRFNLLIRSHSDLILSPPTGFRDDDVILTPQDFRDDDVILTPQVSPSSQILEFSLQIDSDTSSVINTLTASTTTTTTATTNSQIPRKSKRFKTIKVRRKRQRNSTPSSQKKIKVLSGQDELDDVSIDGDISFSPINCEDNESSDIVEPPCQFSHDTSSSSSPETDTTTSSSSCSSSSPQTRYICTSLNFKFLDHFWT